MDDFYPEEYHDDAIAWEENEVFQDECLEREYDDYNPADYEEDCSPYDNDRDFGYEG